MPQMANITVKDKANADVVYTAVSPSAGDRSPAVWRANAASAIIGNRPSFRLVVRDNAKLNGRVFEGSFRLPVTAVINGQETVLAYFPLQVSGTIPTNVNAATVEDGVFQATNLLASALVRASLAEGSAPT